VSTAPVPFAVVGSGWRCDFFLRLARMAPHALRAVGVVTRSAASGDRVTGQDHAVALAIEESARTGADVVVVGEPWA